VCCPASLNYRLELLGTLATTLDIEIARPLTFAPGGGWMRSEQNRSVGILGQQFSVASAKRREKGVNASVAGVQKTSRNLIPQLIDFELAISWRFSVQQVFVL
jgi:hypothetical protein